ncbi:MAG: NAD(P)-dependent oxidoreductase [Proteobacteria bacterium]|nr:NAD(P)-dependent oxidoreductase [Pseudomonadota bacterium]
MICWITERLGTAPFSSVLPEGAVRVDIRELVDRGGNPAEELLGRTDAALEALESGWRVLLCCDHGISRSNAMAALVLALAEGLSFSVAVRRVLDATGDAEMHLDMLGTARAAYARRSGEAEIRRDDSCWLLTGGQGYLGSALRRAAPPGVRIAAPSHGELDLLRGSAGLDLFVRDHGVSRILHFATPRVGNVNSALGESLVMLRNVLDTCAANGASLLLPSRWEVFSGDEGTRIEADEERPLRPKGILGDTKFLLETLAQEYAQRSGLEVTILRSGLVYGRGGGPNFMQGFVRRALGGGPIVTHAYRNGPPALDLLHQDDWVRACLSLLKDGAGGGVYHCGSGRLVQTHDVALGIATALSSPSRVEAVRIDDVTANVLLVSEKLNRATGWTPEKEFETELPLFARDNAATTSQTGGFHGG